MNKWCVLTSLQQPRGPPRARAGHEASLQFSLLSLRALLGLFCFVLFCFSKTARGLASFWNIKIAKEEAQ